jgi:hypothetical protein
MADPRVELVRDTIIAWLRSIRTDLTAQLDNPQPDLVAKLSDGDIRVLLGVRCGLNHAIMAFDGVRKYARKAVERSQDAGR